MLAGAERDMAVRLILFFVTTFAVIGVHLPFFPVFLESRGFDAKTIGIVLAVPLLVRVFAAPAIAFAADRTGAHRSTLIILCAGATATFALFGFATGLWSVLAVAVLFAAVWTSVIPMTESLATQAVRSHGIDYGKIRSFGSLAFILASLAGGWIIEDFGKAAAFWMIFAMIATTLPAALLLPRPPHREEGQAKPLRLADAGRLLGSRVFLLLLAAVTLIQAAHALLYAFGTLHWHATGISPATIGILWALGTGAEIIIFSLAAWPLRRLGPLNLVIIGGLAGAVRWVLTALDPPVGALLFIQLLHAISFGACHLGAVYLLANAVPQRLSATAQGLYSAMVGGIGMGGVMMASGPLYEALAGQAFFVMAGLSAMGVIIGLILSRLWDGKPIIADDPGVSPTAPDPAA